LELSTRTTSPFARTAFSALSLLIVVSFAWQASDPTSTKGMLRMDPREAALQFRLPAPHTQSTQRVRVVKKDKYIGINLRLVTVRAKALAAWELPASCACARPDVLGELWIDLPPPRG